MKLGRRFSPVKTAGKCWEPNQRAPSQESANRRKTKRNKKSCETCRQFKSWLFFNLCLCCCCCWRLFFPLSWFPHVFLVRDIVSYDVLCCWNLLISALILSPCFFSLLFSANYVSLTIYHYILYYICLSIIYFVFMFMFVITRPFLDSRFLHKISSTGFKLQRRCIF